MLLAHRRLTAILAVLALLLVTIAQAALAGPAAAVCGVYNSKSSHGPFWANGQRIDPGHTAPCGSTTFHTGCRYVADRVTTGQRVFGCANTYLGPGWTGVALYVH